MGNSGENPSNGIDVAIGGLVWVCRRNGCWWPGRVLGPDELPEDCIPTPRVGVPIKLLGREDASVDWYNLERSKRVKSFRCGDFDDCIEKAKASASHHGKKAVKYARREDAIIQALKLETSRLEHDLPGFSAGSDESPLPSEEIDEGLSGSGDIDSESPQELSQSGVSFDEQNLVINVNKNESKLGKTLNDSEDEANVRVKRMRGIKDLGMGVASTLKRKKSSQVANFPNLLKRKNRRRILTKFLESTAMVDSQTGVSNASKINNSDITGISCEITRTLVENGKCRTARIPNNRSSQTLLDVPFVSEEKNSAGTSAIVSGASQKTQAVQSSQSSHVDTMSLGNEEQNESGSTSSGTACIPSINIMIEKGTSEWQLKGKRNSRSRKIDIDDEAETDVGGSLITNTGSCPLKSRPITEIQNGWSWNAHKRESPISQRSLPYRQSCFTVNPKYESSDFSPTNGSGLYDVVVEVKTSYKPQQVPYISLMSKMNGRPVIGYPVQIEVLNNGFCDELVNISKFNNVSAFGMVYKRKSRGKSSSKQRKIPKPKKNGLSSRKIRKLSSLTRFCEENEEIKIPIVEKLKGGPVIACVPLNVVFSRINAAFSNTMRLAPPLMTSTSRM